MMLDGQDGRPLIYNRRSEVVTLADVRAAIMRELRIVGAVYTQAERSAAVSAVLADPAWLRRCNGQYLGATARDGFSYAFHFLPARGA
jgi:hypothetical protein